MNDITPTAAQIILFRITVRAGRAIEKSLRTNLGATKAWLEAQYGSTSPTFEQFWEDRDALKYLAAEKGLADDQWVRKPYNMAVKDMYGELPVSLTAEAVAKRAVRSASAHTDGGKAPRRRLVSSKVDIPPDAETAIRQMLGHFGMAQVLLAFSSILAEYRVAAREAIRIKGLGDKVLADPSLARVADPQPQQAAVH